MYFFLGIFLGLLAFYVFTKLFFRKSLPFDVTEYSNSDTAVILPEATVADDLFPITSKLALKDATVTVVGGDGNYITLDNAAKLKQGLRAWCEAGATINYVLVCPTADATREFELLRDELGKSFKLQLIEPCDKLSEFETTHPTLFELHDGAKALWLESDHPKNSSIAYGVKYVSPNAMKNEPAHLKTFHMYLNKIEQIPMLAA